MLEEQVLIVRNNLIEKLLGVKEGLIFQGREEIYKLILQNHAFTIRKLAEYDSENKQVIPYISIINNEQILLLKRTKYQTEKRLHNMYSIGIGGHIGPADKMNELDTILQGLYKELYEEIEISNSFNLEYIGIINDNSTEVSRVHLGLFFVIFLSDSFFSILETNKMTGEWVAINDLPSYYESFENWSRILYDNYFKNFYENNNISAPEAEYKTKKGRLPSQHKSKSS